MYIPGAWAKAERTVFDALLKAIPNSIEGKNAFLAAAPPGVYNVWAYSMEGGGDGAGTVQDHEMWSLFAEDNMRITDALTLTLGLRHDDHNVFGSHLSPRAYAVWDLAPAWTLKGGISTGYKTPKTTDLYDGITGFGGQGTSPFVGNPDLQPETSVNSEIALYWNSGNAGHNFNITVFNNDFKDKIARGETNLSCAQTGGVRGRIG